MTKHTEAFALMWYACSKCGHRERIWNSRDGVTPFGGVPCPSCGAVLTHVEFDKDEPAPDHYLRHGQRFFRDGTPSEAIAIVSRRIAQSAEIGHPIPADIAERLLADAQNQTGEWRPGWPKLDRWGERT